MFSFTFVEGNPETALTEKFSIVITTNMAEKYFGDDMAIGQVLKKDNTDLKVTDVIQIPENSHIQFDYIFPIENMTEWFMQDLHSWNTGPFKTYIQLAAYVSVKNFQNKISKLVKDYKPYSNTTLEFQPLNKIHLFTDFQDQCNYRQGNILYVYIFSIVAFCILGVACINYMNLSTSRSSKRLKEIGIRKAIGAKRKDLVLQFLGESLLLSFISLWTAIILVELILPFFNTHADKNLTLVFSTNFKFYWDYY